jgi:hypothetical protein
MTRDEMLAQLVLADNYTASYPGQPLEAEQVLDRAVARGRIPPFANRLARALAAENMREALQRALVRIDADGTLGERDADMSDSAIDRDNAFKDLAPRQPAPRPNGKPGRPPKSKGE